MTSISGNYNIVMDLDNNKLIIHISFDKLISTTIEILQLDDTQPKQTNIKEFIKKLGEEDCQYITDYRYTRYIELNYTKVDDKVSIITFDPESRDIKMNVQFVYSIFKKTFDKFLERTEV